MTLTVDDLEPLTVVRAAESEAEHPIGSECSDKKDHYTYKKKKIDFRAQGTPHCATNVALLLVLSFMANVLLLMSVLRREGSLSSYRTGNLFTSLSMENISKATNRCDNATTYKAENDGVDALGPPKGVLYGHLHMAKTAGSELNGELANHFERVCGNRGNSYDAFQLNKRFSKHVKEHADGVPSDIVNLQFGGRKSRASVPLKVMREVGFEDCDYISMESSYEFWLDFKDRNLQLHVPCRDPLEHLMSQCNHRKLKFNCDARVLQKEVLRCVFGEQRFSLKLKEQSNISLKCFDAVPPDSYVQYMSSKLQRKKVESEYVHRSTNRPRNREKECIWKNPEVADAVKKILLEKYSYYEFCRQCMGSEDEIASK